MKGNYTQQQLEDFSDYELKEQLSIETNNLGSAKSFGEIREANIIGERIEQIKAEIKRRDRINSIDEILSGLD